MITNAVIATFMNTDTIMIIGCADKGLSEDYLHNEFSKLPGFLMMKYKPLKATKWSSKTKPTVHFVQLGHPTRSYVPLFLT